MSPSIPEVDWSQQPGLLGHLTRLYHSVMGGQQVGSAPQQGMVNASDFNPVSQVAQGAQALANPSQHKMDLAMMAAPFAVGAAGEFMTRPGKLPTTSIEMPGTYNPAKHSLNEIINSRDSVYHATDVNGFHGILDEGAIHPFGGSGKAEYYGVDNPGVSVSRVPRMASKGTKAVSFVIDPKEAPKMRPFTEGDYSKTVANGKDVVPNKRFEYENRTFNEPISLKSVKGVVVDKNALTSEIRYNPVAYWPSNLPEPTEQKALSAFKSVPNYDLHVDSLVDYHINQMKQAAQAKGLPFRVAEGGRQLHSYRAGFSKLPKSTPLWAAGATAAGLATQPGDTDAQ